MNFWTLFILFFFPLVGGVTAALIKDEKLIQLKLFLAFSGAFLISVCSLNILPEIYHHGGSNIGYFVLAGFFLQIIIDQFSKGIEHGHLHLHDVNQVPYSVFIALSAHAFMEGMGVGANIFERQVQNNFVFGIALHEIPAAFALISVLKHSRKDSKFIYVWLIAYALMVPGGALLSHVLKLNSFVDSQFFYGLMAVVAGVFLHISTTILFENSDNHKITRYKLISIASGVLLALLAANFHLD